MTAPAIRRGYRLAVASVALVTVAQLAMKWGMTQLPALDARWLHIASWLLAGRPLLCVAIGILCYLASLLCWLQALARLPLNKAYPLLSLSYVLVFVASVALPGFHESYTLTQVLGVALVSCGVWLVLAGRSSGSQPAAPQPRAPQGLQR